ncbi:MAG TPA: CBS domain-containing protein [Myxococcota bacterium]|nr:CBS domain-containing protein [Myxococcota bacterium]
MSKRQTVRDVMTPDPIVLDLTATVRDAARAMRARDIGDVLVANEGRFWGILTDRDIVVRAVAEHAEAPGLCKLADVCTTDVECLGPDEDVMAAIRVMERSAVRRIPVVEEGRAIGVVTLGDLAVARDRESVLGKISAAPPLR